MTVAELIDRLIAAYPGASPEALATFKPVFYARFGKREGEPLKAAFDATLAEFKPKYGQPFPIPADFERHMPNGKLDLGRGDSRKLDFDGRKRRADGLVADWRAGQGTRAAKGNQALMRALENMAQPLANALAWAEPSESLVLTRDQLKLAAQRAISFERLLRFGQPPRDGTRWWEQISAIAADWQMQITPEWWDDQTAKALADLDGSSSRVERVRASTPLASSLPPPPNPAMKAALMRSSIKFFNDMGMVDMVAQKQRELAEFEEQFPEARIPTARRAVDEPPPPDDIPEAMEMEP